MEVRSPRGIAMSIGLLLLLQTAMLSLAVLAALGNAEAPCEPGGADGDCWAAGLGALFAWLLVPFSIGCLTTWFILLAGLRRGEVWAPRMALWVAWGGVGLGAISYPIGLPWLGLSLWLRSASRPLPLN